MGAVKGIVLVGVVKCLPLTTTTVTTNSCLLHASEPSLYQDFIVCAVCAYFWDGSNFQCLFSQFSVINSHNYVGML